MSALLPKADIRQRIEYVCFVPLADIQLEPRSYSTERLACTVLKRIALPMKALYQVSSGEKPSGYFSFIECIKDRKFFWFPQLTE